MFIDATIASVQPGATKIHDAPGFSPWLVPAVAVALLALWVALLQLFHPGVVATSDEWGYVAQGFRIAEEGSLESGAYHYETLRDQEPPLRAAHTPGYAMVLGTYFRAFDIGPGDVVAHETLPSVPNYALGVCCGLVLFVALQRTTTARWAPWVGLGVFLVFPAVTMYATMAMAEITLMAVVTAALVLLVGTAKTMPRWDWRRVAAGIALLAFGMLIRWTVALALPVLVILLARAYGRRRMARISLGIGVALLVTYALSTNRVRFPGSTTAHLSKEVRRSPSDGVRAVFDNLTLNMERMWDHFPSLRYTFVKHSVWLLMALMVIAFLANRSGRSPLATATVAYFALNTLGLFLMYDVEAWRGIRVTMTLVPLAILVVMQGADRVASSHPAGRVVGPTLVGILIALASMSVYAVDRRTDEVLAGVERRDTAAAAVGPCFENLAEPTVLIPPFLGRARLAHPHATWVFLQGGGPQGGFEAIDAKIGFDCLVVPQRRQGVAPDEGELVAEIAGFATYRTDGV